MYEDVIEAGATAVFCEYSNDFFAKFEYGCYNEILWIVMFLLFGYIFVRAFVWLLTKVFG